MCIHYSEKIRICVGIIIGLVLLSTTVITEASPFVVTSPFGWRTHPISGEWKFHSGVDIGLEYGEPVLALYDGQVVQSGDFNDGYGNQILLYHSQYDCFTRYAHMSAIYVEAGENIQRGILIGKVGATGNVTGPHLHLEYIPKNHNTGGYEYADPLLLWQ